MLGGVGGATPIVAAASAAVKQNPFISVEGSLVVNWEPPATFMSAQGSQVMLHAFLLSLQFQGYKMTTPWVAHTHSLTHQ